MQGSVVQCLLSMIMAISLPVGKKRLFHYAILHHGPEPMEPEQWSASSGSIRFGSLMAR